MSAEVMFLPPKNFQVDFNPITKISVRQIEIERRIILLGRSAAGKSATANTIFGRHTFLESKWGRFQTTQCQRGIVSRFGMRLEILDTPGFLLDSDISEPKTRREFAKCIGVSSPGPHVFAFVFPAAHMHKCDLEIFQRFVSVFGEDVLNYTILLFTKTDDLDHFSLTKQSFILSASAEWKSIMKSCNYRCVWFQNRANPLEKELMVRTFIDMMEITINKNMGRHFTNDLYWEAEKALVMRNLANVDHDKRVEKLTRRLRINLDAGPLTRFGELRKSTATRRERMRREIESDNVQVIDRIWNSIKMFHCLKILKRPKLPHIPKQTLPKIHRRTLKPSRVYRF